jgi:hypothetical protein
MTEQHPPQTQKDHILNHPRAVHTMHKVSQLSIKLSGVILLFVILFVLVRLASPSKIPPPQIAVSNVPTAQPTLAKIKFDLDGPLSCDYRGKEASVSATILNKQMFVNVSEATKSASYLLKDECFYSWDTKTLTGTKSCELGPIISTIELVSSFGGGIDLQTILENLPSGASITKDTNEINAIAETCLDEATNSALFKVPTNVTFVEEKPAQ